MLTAKKSRPRKSPKLGDKPRSISLLLPPSLRPAYFQRRTESVIEDDCGSPDRPLSWNADSISEFDRNMQRKSHTLLSISPRMLRSWVARKCTTQSNVAHIYFPTQSLPSFDAIR